MDGPWSCFYSQPVLFDDENTIIKKAYISSSMLNPDDTLQMNAFGYRSGSQSTASVALIVAIIL